MEITLNNFKCWKKIKLQFKSNCITLIKGDSGIGKTTILQAIAWCLYGNIKKVAPFEKKNLKTKVKIIFKEYNQMTITRKKNPNILNLIIGENSYDDKEAQELINEKFGNYDVWLCSCFISQGSKNSFLTSPANGKLELLNSICFGQKDPSEIIDKIKNKTKSITEEYNQKKLIYQNELNKFNEEFENVKKFSEEDNPEEIIDEIEKLKLSISKDENLMERRKALIDQKKQMENKLIKLEKDLKNLDKPELELEVINELYDKKIKYEELEIKLRNARRGLLEEPSKNFLEYFSTNFDEKKKETIRILDEIKYQEKISKEVKINYNLTSIEKKIKELEIIINSNEENKLISKQNELLNQIDNLKKDFKLLSNFSSPKKPENPESEIKEINHKIKQLDLDQDDLKNKINELKFEIKYLEQKQDVLNCPKCDAELIFSKDHLICFDIEKPKEIESDNLIDCRKKLKEFERKLSIIQEQYDEELLLIKKLNQTYQKDLEKYNSDQIKFERNKVKLEENEKKRNELESLLIKDLSTNLNITVYSEKEIDQFKIKLDRLKSIKIIEEPEYQLEDFDTYLDYLKSKEETEKITKEINDLGKIPEERSNYYYELKKEYLSYQKNSEKIINSIELLKEEIKEIIIIDDLTENIKNNKEKLEKLEKRIKLHNRCIKMNEEEKKINQKYSKLLVLKNEYLNTLELKRHSIDLECKILQDTVDEINQVIENTCSSLFNDTILINLELFKTVKSTKETKPEINFQISFKGGSFDNINQLSGGESDRCSLALTLALNRLSSCPLLMLDESLSSVNHEMKDSSLKTIRKTINGIVLVVMHDSTEGIYDDVIDISEYSKD